MSDNTGIQIQTFGGGNQPEFHFLFTDDSGTTWHEFMTFVGDTVEPPCRNILFVDTDISFVWIRYRLAVTYNGGRIWKILDYPAGKDCDIRDILFETAHQGIMKLACFSSKPREFSYLDMVTNDGGLTWKRAIDAN